MGLGDFGAICFFEVFLSVILSKNTFCIYCVVLRSYVWVYIRAVCILDIDSLSFLPFDSSKLFQGLQQLRRIFNVQPLGLNLYDICVCSNVWQCLAISGNV